ncbi:MAG: hypothetical protein Q9220_001495 [cf. Caloplaca sp. 1 TL-2023]
MPMIWRLHTSTSNKIGLSLIFALGTLDIIVGILRIVYLVDLDDATDYTWVAVNCWVWSVLEPGLAVQVVCAPTLGPVLSVLFERVRCWTGTEGKTDASYPSRSERREHFDNISDSEYPLRPMYGNQASAWSQKGNERREQPDVENGQAVKVETRFDVDTT